MFSKYPKSHQTFGLFLRDNLSPRTFKNRPIWSHCSHAIDRLVSRLSHSSWAAVVSVTKITRSRDTTNRVTLILLDSLWQKKWPLTWGQVDMSWRPHAPGLDCEQKHNSNTNNNRNIYNNNHILNNNSQIYDTNNRNTYNNIKCT